MFTSIWLLCDQHLVVDRVRWSCLFGNWTPPIPSNGPYFLCSQQFCHSDYELQGTVDRVTPIFAAWFTWRPTFMRSTFTMFSCPLKTAINSGLAPSTLAWFTSISSIFLTVVPPLSNVRMLQKSKSEFWWLIHQWISSFLKSRSTILSYPLLASFLKGVTPFLFAWFTKMAPCLSSSSTILLWLLSVAMSNGVAPILLVKFIWIPSFCSNISTTLWCPCLAASATKMVSLIHLSIFPTQKQLHHTEMPIPGCQ